MNDQTSRRHEGPAHMLDIVVERGSAISIGRQIYLALRALRISVQHRRPAQSLLFHSDQGVQYSSDTFNSHCVTTILLRA